MVIFPSTCKYIAMYSHNYIFI